MHIHNSHQIWDTLITHFFSFISSHRCLPLLLDSLLCPSHPAGPLSGLPHSSGAHERGHVARLCQQRPQPRHLHGFQHRIQEPFQKASASLLLQESLRRRKRRKLQDLFLICSSTRRSIKPTTGSFSWGGGGLFKRDCSEDQHVPMQ